MRTGAPIAELIFNEIQAYATEHDVYGRRTAEENGAVENGVPPTHGDEAMSA